MSSEIGHKRLTMFQRCHLRLFRPPPFGLQHAPRIIEKIPSDRVRRNLAASESAFVFRLLPRVENAFVAEQGRPGSPAGASRATGKRHCHSPGWRAASPIRTPRRLNFAPALTLQQGSVCSRLALVEVRSRRLTPSTDDRGEWRIQPQPSATSQLPDGTIGSPPPRHPAAYEVSDNHSRNGQPFRAF